LLLIGLLVVIVSCSGSKETTNSIPVEDLPKILREASNAGQDSAEQQSSEPMTLNYKNESTDLTIPIDPQGQDFVLELEGVKAQEEEPADSLALQDSVVQERMAEKIKEVLKTFRRAQNLFYRQDYKGAMEMVDESLELQETADALGLKGTIYFMRDDLSSAKYYWNKAVQMDPEIPVPDIPELESLIEDIKDSEETEEGTE
jgi:tetratricopeptide (TPR) repeat protein